MKTYGGTLPVGEINDPVKIGQLVVFVNSLPQAWHIPWSGAPVGKVYFQFHRAGNPIGDFYVGPGFFGRGHWSQSASKEQIQVLGAMIGFDLWGYLQEKIP